MSAATAAEGELGGGVGGVGVAATGVDVAEPSISARTSLARLAFGVDGLLVAVTGGVTGNETEVVESAAANEWIAVAEVEVGS